MERRPADARLCRILGLSHALASECREKVEPKLVPTLAHLYSY